MAANRLKDPRLWKKKARAFVTRCHRHLWGKNNEDPLVFLYQQDLANQFVKDMHLGWNKHGQERRLAKWGFDQKKMGGKKIKARVNDRQEDTFILPPGIVFPYIVEKELVSVWIQPLDLPGPSLLVPGSQNEVIRLGNPGNPIKSVDGLFEGLRLFQENRKTLCIEIRP
jgi:hypothetical protein